MGNHPEVGENRYLTFFEQLEYPVVFINREGTIDNLNHAAAGLTGMLAESVNHIVGMKHGVDLESLRGKPFSEVFPWLAGLFRDWLDNAGQDSEVFVNLSEPLGEKVFRVSLNRLPGVSGISPGFSIVLQDETERFLSREQILRAKSELERTFDTISDLVFLVDGAGVFQRVNKSLADRFGFSPKEMVGLKCPEVLGCPECWPEEHVSAFKEISATFPGLPGNFMARSNAFIDDDGSFRGRVVVLRDVTAAEKIQETLTSIESKYKSIFDHAPVGIFQSTPEGVYLSVNATMAGMFGFSSADEMIRHYTDIGSQMYVNPQDRLDLIAEGLESGIVPAREVQLLRCDGNAFWVRLRGRIVRDAVGRILYVEGFMEDVTGRRAARENLSRSEQRFRSLAESMSQGLVQIDLDGVIGYCNDHFCTLVRRRREELISTPFPSLVHVDDRGVCREIFDREVCFLPGSRFDLRVIADGGVRFTLVTPVALQSAEGECQGFWLLILDITERRMLESQLLQNQKLEAIGQLAAGIAHEINTPTQYVMNNMWFIKEGVAQLEQALAAYRSHGKEGAAMRAIEENLQIPFYLEELPAAISETLQGLDRISVIVNSVKQFAHPGHDRHQAVDLNALVDQTVTLSRNEWKYVAEMVTDLDPDLPPVICSSQQMGQVLLNLVVNAAHAIMDYPRDGGRPGLITIRTRMLGDTAEIRVEDTGSGIPVHAREHLFEPFFTTKPVGKGTGQGLFIAHRAVVKDHGGSIRFETELGHGTSFIITLPVAGQQEDEDHE